ncbi:MAG: hypothetical protein HZA54_04775 [Planctomycetes bacterium]|nr:hypothetical protein [Planctomycetota bacterium]
MFSSLLAALLLYQVIPWGDQRVQVHPDGGLGRICAERAFLREVEDLERRPAVAPGDANVWKVRAFIFRELDFKRGRHVGKRRFTDAELAALQAVVRDFARCVAAYSRGALRLDLETRVIEAPLRRLSGDAKPGFSAWTDVTAEFIGEHVDDDVHSVLVYFPSAGLPVPYWGGTTGGDTMKRAGYSCICVLDAIDHETYVEVTLHEWLHQVDWARAERSGYSDLPDLHGAEELGYSPGAARRGWMDWYRDFMTDYVAPRTWARLSMLREDPELPRPGFAGGFVRAWRVAGPFDNEQDEGFTRDDVPAADPPVAEWRRVADAETLDFLPLFERKENVSAYAHVYLKPGAPGPARLWLGSDDGVRAWLNGELVHDRHAHRPLKRDQDRVDVELEGGWNRLLLKVDQGGGGWAATLRVSRPDGSALPGLEFAADPPPASDLARPRSRAPRLPDEVFAWSAVREDPFRKLPQLDPRDLGASGGENFLALGDTPESRLEFATRALARRGDLWLVRCDALPVIADLDVAYEQGELRPGRLEDHLLGWVAIAGRVAFVARHDPGFTPGCDVDLLGARQAGGLAHLQVEGAEAVLRTTVPLAAAPPLTPAEAVSGPAVRGRDGREWRWPLRPGHSGFLEALDLARCAGAGR